MKSINIFARPRAAALISFCAILVVACGIWMAGGSSAQKMSRDISNDSDENVVFAGTVSGKVFQDFNGNGNFDTAAGTNSIDIGVAGVTVTAYDAAGVNSGSAVTNASGVYSIGTSGSTGYRVEFSNLPAGFTPSARNRDSVNAGTSVNSGSTVQFVAAGATTNVNLAINRYEEYCDDNPTLVTSRFAQGSSDGPYSANAALWDFAYASGTTYTDTTVANYDNPTTHALTVKVSAIGTVNALAYNRVTNRVYAAAYFKTHAGFGPGANGTLNNSDDPGAIYVINPTNNTVTSTFTVAGATTNSHDTTDYNADNNNTGWNGTGKTSLGGMALADDNSRLFVMNLQNRQLYALNPTTGVSLGNSADTSGLTMLTPNGSATSCPTADRRPFAVKYYRGNVYVGVVCSGESTDRTRDLYAYVFQVNPTTLVYTTTPVYTVRLNYSRGFADPSVAAEWQPWSATKPTDFAYPQPMLSDLEFDNGDLILGLRDRTGDSSFDTDKRTAGDTIRACGSFGAWTTESNGRCGGTGSGTQNNGQGIGNAEFYYQDDFCTAPNNGNYHDEVAWGAILQIPGRQDVVATVLDPISRTIANGATFDGGVRLFNRTTGGTDRAYRIYDGSGGTGQPDFGKTNGLGDMTALCKAAPIEIGNRVWRDTNSNGIQDAGELGIANVTVHLYNSANVLVGTAVTSANGEYYFVSSSVADPNTGDSIGQINGGIGYNANYSIRLDLPANYNIGGALAGLIRTIRDQNPPAGVPDASDSDGNSYTNPAGSPTGTWPAVYITTGGVGSNDHTYDFGFVNAPPSAANVSLSGRIVTANGNGIKNLQVILLESNGHQHIATTSSFGYYRFDELEGGGGAVVSISSKRFTFAIGSRFVSLDDDIVEFNWVSNE